MNSVISSTSVALAAVLAACVHVPGTAAAQTVAIECAAIEAQIATAAQRQRTAAQQQQDAWKAVVPFAVLARYGQGKAAVHESQQRLDALRQDAALRGCAIPTHGSH